MDAKGERVAVGGIGRLGLIHWDIAVISQTMFLFGGI